MFKARAALLGLATLAVLALALIALPTANVSAQAAGQGKIEGQLVDGTKDAKFTASNGITITLYSAPMGATSANSVTVKSDPDGKFTVGSLDTVTTTRYLVQANYSGVDYYSDVINFGIAQTTLPVSMTVYETTTDPKTIKVSQAHFVFDMSAGALNVLQIVAVSNDTDRAYIGQPGFGPHRITMSLPILPGATNVQFDNPNADETTLRGNGIMTYTMPIPPGGDQIVFNYALTYTAAAYPFNLTIPWDADKVRFLLPDNGSTLTGTQFSALTQFPTQSGQSYLLSSVDNVKAGTVLAGKLDKIPADSPTTLNPGGTPSSTTPSATAKPADNSQLIGAIVLGLAALLAVGLLAYPFLRRRQSHVPPAVATQVNDKRTALLQAIADLDDDYEAKKITEAEYQVQRDALKARLLKMENAE